MLPNQKDPLHCPKKDGNRYCKEVRQIGFHELDKVGLQYINGNIRLKSDENNPNIKVILLNREYFVILWFKV